MAKCCAGTGSAASKQERAPPWPLCWRRMGPPPPLYVAPPTPTHPHVCRAGIPTDGYLSNNRTPSAADWAAAFPSEPVDFARLNSPPGEGCAPTCRQRHAPPVSLLPSAGGGLSCPPRPALVLLQPTRCRGRGWATPPCCCSWRGSPSSLTQSSHSAAGGPEARGWSGGPWRAKPWRLLAAAPAARRPSRSARRPSRSARPAARCSGLAPSGWCRPPSAWPTRSCRASTACC